MREICCFIIDDDPRAADMMESLLKQSAGFTVAGSETVPEKAVSIILSRRPEVLFIDVEMPGMTGLELLDEVKSRFPQINVSMISAYGDSENYNRAKESGAKEFFTKPIDFNSLKKEILELKG